MENWLDKAIIYQLIIDRFSGFSQDEVAHKPLFVGGKINGIRHRLGYLSELGINALLLSPFMKTTAYHGYHVTDFYEVEKRFGSEYELKALIKEAHDAGIRIIADFVPNHCSVEHVYFKEAVSNPRNPYRKWFYFRNWPYDYQSFLWVKELPKLNLEHPEAAEYMIGAALHWLGMGIDGLRIDHVIGLPLPFLKALKERTSAAYPESVLIGEAWLEGIKFKYLNTLRIPGKHLKWLTGFNQENIQLTYVPYLDGILDFVFRKIMLNRLPLRLAHSVNRKLRSHYAHYPEGFKLLSFLDNHDTNRFLHVCNNNIDTFRQAIDIQFAQPQPPIIYYGTEAGMTHHQPVSAFEPYSDLYARQPMRWQKIDKVYYNIVKEAIADRKARLL